MAERCLPNRALQVDVCTQRRQLSHRGRSCGKSKKIAEEDTLVVATATCIRVPGGAKVFETPQCRGFLIKDGK